MPSLKRTLFVRTLAAVAAASLLVFGAGQRGSAQGIPTIKLGASLALTGGLASEGVLVREGYDYMVNLINSRGGITVDGKRYNFEIKYYDDQSQAATAVQLTTKLIEEDKVNFLLGPYGSGATNATSSVAEKYKIPMVAAHGSANTIYERGYKYIFGVLNPVDQYPTPMLKLAAEMKPAPKTIAFIREDGLFANLGIEAAVKQATALGMKVVYNEKYPTGTKDFSTMIAAIRAQKPEMLIGAGYQGDMIVITRQVRENNLDLKMLGFLLGPTVRGYVETLGPLAEGALEPTQWNSDMNWHDKLFNMTSEQFAADFAKTHNGAIPDYHQPQSAAAVEVFYNAIRVAKSLDPQKVRDAIASSKFESFYGPIVFNELGINVGKSMAAIQVQKGKFPVVYPAKYAEAKPIYPLK